MPSFLAYRLGLMSHLGSTFPKNDGPGPCPGGQFFHFFFVFFQNVLKRALGALGGLGGPWGGPGGPISPIFRPFPPSGGPLFFLLYRCDIPPISPSMAAALV